MSRYDFGWRDRVDDPNWLRWCVCGHTEQIHAGACTAGPHGNRCICDGFHEKRREWVGLASEHPDVLANPATDLVAVLTLMLDDTHAAARYINELPELAARRLAGFACREVVNALQEAADEEHVAVHTLLQAVALRVAEAAT